MANEFYGKTDEEFTNEELLDEFGKDMALNNKTGDLIITKGLNYKVVKGTECRNRLFKNILKRSSQNIYTEGLGGDLDEVKNKSFDMDLVYLKQNVKKVLSRFNSLVDSEMSINRLKDDKGQHHYLIRIKTEDEVLQFTSEALIN